MWNVSTTIIFVRLVVIESGNYFWDLHCLFNIHFFPKSKNCTVREIYTQLHKRVRANAWVLCLMRESLEVCSVRDNYTQLHKSVRVRGNAWSLRGLFSSWELWRLLSSWHLHAANMKGVRTRTHARVSRSMREIWEVCFHNYHLPFRLVV